MAPVTPEHPERVAVLHQACEALAEKAGIEIVRDRMPSLGGLCRLRGGLRLYVNETLDEERQLEVIARALAEVDLSDHYVLPALRAEIDRYR